MLHPFAPVFPVLSAVHTAAGHYVYLSEGAFARLGVDTAGLFGRPWQEFAPTSEVDAEIEAVQRAFASGMAVTLSRVQRRWSALPLALDVTITPINSRRGTRLIMREARVIQTSETFDAEASAARVMDSLRAVIGLHDGRGETARAGAGRVDDR